MTSEELKAKFNPEGSQLRKVQLRMVEILKEIDKICTKHNLSYWLCGGSLIGAMRHKGFIPWDDDIDIEMPIQDYKKFIEICKSELPDNLQIQSHKNDRYYFFPYAKVRDLHSHITELTGVDKFYKLKGAFVDVFPCKPINKPCYKISRFMQLNFLIRPAKYLPYKLFHRFVLLPVYWLTTGIYRIFDMIDKIIGSKGISAVYGASYYIKPFPEDKVLPTVRSNFEGCQFCIPKDADWCLTAQYGDYMQLPPIDKIEIHAEKIELD